MSQLDSSVIKHTQQTLGKYVKKPPLTEKLLTKPPFRFLHDVFNAVIKETDCFVGLYTPEELNFESIKDRGDKMRFLQKMIDVIKITSNKPLTIRTSKIVAGLEPEKTNELLQLMGEAIENKLDWRRAVEEVVNGKGTEKSKDTTKLKVPDKPVDKKNKDKVNEKSKDKENRVKDTKTKDAKMVGKTNAIPMKSDKLLKRNADDKEKVNVKTSQSQIPKGAKEKNEIKMGKPREKLKSAKGKNDHKEDTATPIEKEEPEVINVSSKIPNEYSMNRAQIEMDNKISEFANENSRRDSKSLEQETLSSTMLLNEHSTLDRVPDVDASSKSSAKRKKSSGYNRRSSTSVSVQDEIKSSTEESVNETKDESDKRSGAVLRKPSSGALRNIELKQEEQQQQQQQAPASPIQQDMPKAIIQKQSPIQSPAPPPPTAVPPKPAEVRRESTFTRENSRDSNNSNNVTNRPRTSLRPPSARPASARPGAPRRRDRNIEIVLQPNDQVKMSGINVKLENFGDLDDDGENLVVIEDANSPNIGESVEGVKNVDESNIENNLKQQGHLVQQILETQKELMQQQNANSAAGKSEKDVDLANSSTARQSSARQMNNLRDIIQNLTKSVNPFGKLLDFIPEDIDAMQLELTMWRDTYTQVSNELRREKSLTESATEPMKDQLVQIESSIKEFTEMIDVSRTKILQNSQKIFKMLAEQ